MKRYVVIMAGGAGERFWPLSRIARPKHLWDVTGKGECLLMQTLKRVDGIVPSENILIVTNAEQVPAITKECPGFPREHIISEPCPRDTSAAIALCATLIKRMSKSEDSSFAVFPSDQVVSDVSAFKDTIQSVFEIAELGDNLATIGIKPDYPATGYGYIRRGSPFPLASGQCYKIARFYEKPNLARATAYYESGDFYWNAGIFAWKTSSILNALQRYIPDTHAAFFNIEKRLDSGEDLASVLSDTYPRIEKISIDFAVLERCDNAYVVPALFDWDDVGSWSAVERHYPKGPDGNIARGRLFSKDSSDCVVFDAAGRTTALVGVKDIIVVHSEDATLVCSRDSAESLKALVRSLPQDLR